MSDKRRLPRKAPKVSLYVTDCMSGDVIGQLGNLSENGLLLLSSEPIADDSLYQLQFNLPDQHGRLHPVELGVHEQWSEPGAVPGQHWVGFRIIDIGHADLERVRHWLQHAEGSKR